MLPRAVPIFPFHGLKSMFLVINKTLCSSRADPILVFHALKSVFNIKN